jgi:hypothetical protein
MILIVAGGQFMCFVVNVICEDFVWFILIFHFLNRSCRRSRCCWSFCDANAAYCLLLGGQYHLRKLLL